MPRIQWSPSSSSPFPTATGAAPSRSSPKSRGLNVANGDWVTRSNMDTSPKLSTATNQDRVRRAPPAKESDEQTRKSFPSNSRGNEPFLAIIAPLRRGCPDPAAGVTSISGNKGFFSPFEVFAFWTDRSRLSKVNQSFSSSASGPPIRRTWPPPASLNSGARSKSSSDALG